MRTTKVSTWLPLFSGFYDSIWDSNYDEERELDWINEQRIEADLPEVTWDDVEWDYKGYQKAVVEGVTKYIGEALVEDKFIKAYKLEKLVSPREYNFATDSIHVQMTVTNESKRHMRAYIDAHLTAFTKYLKDRYTSYDGFHSSYSNDVNDWLDDFDATVTHRHKLGALLEFILRHDDQVREEDIHEYLSGNGVTVQASNYSKLVPEKAA